MSDTIGSWTPSQLAKYVQDMWLVSPPPIPTGSTVEEIGITKRLVVAGDLQIDQTATSVGSLAKYFRLTDLGGKPFYVPGYNP